jgi:AraC family L-rhamnose operon transcriptional activator RhaR
MTTPASLPADEWSRYAREVTRRRSHLDFAARDVTSESAPGFGWVGPFLLGSEISQPRAHDWLEISVIVSGRGHFLSPRGVLPLEAGSVIVVRPGVWGALVDSDMVSADLGVSPLALADELSFLRSRPAFRALLYPSPHAVDGVLAFQVGLEAAIDFAAEVERVHRLQIEHPQDRVVILGQLLVALGVLARALPGADATRPHPAVEATLRRLEEAPERAWRLTDLARAAALDPAYLVRLFRTHVGVPPMTHLARVRVARAAALLDERRLSVAQVGAAVGWPDPDHFSRRFREIVGLSPRRYRERVRGPADAASRRSTSDGFAPITS